MIATLVCLALGGLVLLCLYVWDAGYRARIEDDRKERAESERRKYERLLKDIFAVRDGLPPTPTAYGHNLYIAGGYTEPPTHPLGHPLTSVLGATDDQDVIEWLTANPEKL